MTEKSTTKETINSLSVQTVMTVAMAILSLVSFSILSRLLTKEDFGYFAAISAIVAIFDTLTEAGFGSAVIQKKDVHNAYVDTAFSLALYTGVLFSILLFVMSDVLACMVADSSIASPLKVMSICIFFSSLNSVTKAHMTRNLEFKRIGLYNIYAQIVAMCFAIVCAYYGMGVYAIVVQNIILSVFSFGIFYCNLEYRPKWFSVDRRSVSEIFSFGGWLTASCIFRTIYQQMDKLLMGRWLSISLLGAYNRPAGFISQMSQRFNGILDTVLFPILSSIQDDKDKIRRAYDKMLYAINLYSSILCIVFIVSNKWIIDIFFGTEWESISVVFCILSLSLLLSVNGRIMDCFIRSLAYVKMGFYLRILACFITFGCLFVGKNYGINGVAIAVVISNYLIIFTKLWYIGHKIEVPFWHTLCIMFKPLRYTIYPIVLIMIFYSQISHNIIWSILATIFTIVFYVGLIICFPRVSGDFIMEYMYKKLPLLKKFRII